MMMPYDDAMRTIIDLPEDQLAALDAWRAARGVSRAEAVRRAVATLLDTDVAREAARDAAWGLWKARAVDGLAEQERIRSEWDDR
jgi:Arc/MetJ-type ribon-helix-helix transcriptional regulator